MREQDRIQRAVHAFAVQRPEAVDILAAALQQELAEDETRFSTLNAA